ncbi:TPA: hypothetical protein SG275_001464 [Campylobacter coli]|nr:hypothetical protein [Campylobacter coli]
MYDDIVMNVIQNKGLAQASNDFRAILLNKFDNMTEVKTRLNTIEKYRDMRDSQFSANNVYNPDRDSIS